MPENKDSDYRFEPVGYTNAYRCHGAVRDAKLLDMEPKEVAKMFIEDSKELLKKKGLTSVRVDDAGVIHVIKK